MQLDYIVTKNDKNKTVKDILLSKLHISHRLLTKLKKENCIFLNNSPIFVDKKVSLNDTVTANFDYEEDIVRVLASSHKPTLAAINGYALGGGMELALACDFRIGIEKCTFSAPEYGFGWVPGWGGVHRLAALIGPNKAKEMLLMKKKVKGPEALSIGLLNEMVDDPEQLIPRALEMACSLAELNPLTVTYTKTILNDFFVPPYDSLLQGLTNSVTSKSSYAQEKVQEFFNRKK